MRRLFISAGHSANGGTDKGVPPTPFSKGKTEGELTLALRNAIVDSLTVMGIKVYKDKDTNALKETLAHIKNIFTSKPNDILIDILFNAFNGKANGVEAIIPTAASIKEVTIAQRVCELFSNFGFKNRGVKDEKRTARGTLGWMRPSGENILIEVCFMDNEGDMKIYFEKFQEIQYTLALLLRDEFLKNS